MATGTILFDLAGAMPTDGTGTTAGNSLQVVLSAAVTVGIEVTYWDDDAS